MENSAAKSREGDRFQQIRVKEKSEGESTKIGWGAPAKPDRDFFTATQRNKQIWDLHYENGADAGYAYQEVDGFFVYRRSVENHSEGYWESWHMRAIADILDWLNAPWEAQIAEEFGD